jgi:hypothetical protein
MTIGLETISLKKKDLKPVTDLFVTEFKVAPSARSYRPVWMIRFSKTIVSQNFGFINQRDTKQKKGS